MTRDKARSAPSEPPKRRTQAARRAEAERRLLDAAVELVAEKGLAALTLAEVGQRAGYSRGLPVHYFSTRAGLVTAMTQQVTRDYLDRVRAQPQHESPLAALLSLAEYYLIDVEQNPARWRVFFAVAGAALNDLDAAKALATVNARAIRGFVYHLRHAIEAAEVPAQVEPRTEAVLILANLRGLAALMLSDPGNADIVRARNAFRTSLERKLRA